MKILRLQFKNLNSLYGEWEIDFTHFTFQNDGLFVLSGPTGAGKSTILDAVCLALYGQTPRLGKITQAGNEIMSKHTADCYALLEFETKGTHYYARFDQKKARNNPNGKLQDVERSIAKDMPTNILCRKKTEINDEIVRITGMDFPRFTRSILLAQGAFDSFLKAKDEEKSMLLEQITGTEIYTEISKAVFERTRFEKEKTLQLTPAAENSQLLSEEEIKELQESQAQHETELVTLQHALKQIQDCLVWLNQIQELETKIAEEQKKYTELLQRQTSSHEQKIRLLNAEKAEKLNPEYLLIKQVEKELLELTANCAEKEKKVPEQENSLRELTQKLEQIQKDYLEQHNIYEEKKPLFNEIKKIDTILETQKRAMEKLQAQMAEDEKENTSIDAQQTQLSAEKNAIAEKLASLHTWLTNNQHIENLKPELSAIKQKFEQLNTIIIQGKHIKNEILTQEKALTVQKENKKSQEIIQKQLSTEIETQKKQFNEQLNTITLLLDNSKLEDLQKHLFLLQEKKTLLNKIASLEEQRKSLQDGMPCPLCGAKEHPYALGQLPSQSNLDKEMNQLEKRIKEIGELQHKQETISLLITKNEEQLSILTQSLTEFSKQLNEKEQSIHKLNNERSLLLDDYEKEKQKLEQQLVKFSIPALIPEQTDTIYAQLQESCALWERKNKEKQEVEKSLQEKDIQLAQNTEKQKLCLKNIALKNQQLKSEQEEYNAQKENREKRFGQKNPLEEENSLQKAIKDLEKEKEKISLQKEVQNQEVIKTKEQINQLLLQIDNKKRQVSERNENFSRRMEEQGFSSLEDFLTARLEHADLVSLQEFFKNLEQEIEVVKKQCLENSQHLEREKNKQLTQKSIQEIEEQNKILSEKQNTLLLELGQLKEKLEQNQKNMEAQQENLAKLEAQKIIMAKWDSLNALIGSFDGKKFRTIAQGITFEHVIHYANNKLQLLQKRYLLVRDEQNPLHLNVLDNYQGGEIRAVQNLSGGESFIVSLSLALGLAQIASQNVQVDSLFLDEGFGTLDEDNLETALSTLASIQQEGKLIGVISHIPLLKERISTQIDIVPEHGGRSILKGAGCRKLA